MEFQTKSSKYIFELIEKIDSLGKNINSYAICAIIFPFIYAFGYMTIGIKSANVYILSSFLIISMVVFLNSIFKSISISSMMSNFNESETSSLLK
jgi:hypothetical protein